MENFVTQVTQPNPTHGWTRFMPNSDLPLTCTKLLEVDQLGLTIIVVFFLFFFFLHFPWTCSN